MGFERSNPTCRWQVGSAGLTAEILYFRQRRKCKRIPLSTPQSGGIFAWADNGIRKGGLCAAQVSNMPVACCLARGRIHKAVKASRRGVGTALSFSLWIWDSDGRKPRLFHQFIGFGQTDAHLPGRFLHTHGRLLDHSSTSFVIS